MRLRLEFFAVAGVLGGCYPSDHFDLREQIAPNLITFLSVSGSTDVVYIVGRTSSGHLRVHGTNDVTFDSSFEDDLSGLPLTIAPTDRMDVITFERDLFASPACLVNPDLRAPLEVMLDVEPSNTWGSVPFKVPIDQTCGVDARRATPFSVDIHGTKTSTSVLAPANIWKRLSVRLGPC